MSEKMPLRKDTTEIERQEDEKQKYKHICGEYKQCLDFLDGNVNIRGNKTVYPTKEQIDQTNKRMEELRKEASEKIRSAVNYFNDSMIKNDLQQPISGIVDDIYEIMRKLPVQKREE